MRKFYKKIALAILALVFSLSFIAACNTKENNDDDNNNQQPVADTIAPVISFNGEVIFTMNSGESITLPSASANDETDGDLTDDIYVYAAAGSKYAAIADGKFTSNSAGEHTIFYYVEDKAGNEALESVKVTVNPIIPENFDVTGKNDITALAQSGGVFKENFEKMNNSPLIYNALDNHVSLEATSKSIAGNSLIVDYALLEGKENRIFFGNLMTYVVTGRWDISFDVKLVSGTGFSDFYFGYEKNGEVTSKDQQYSLSALTEGQTMKITYSQILDLGEGEFFFHIFKLSQTENLNCVLAFDNFEFKFTEADFSTYIPTIEELNFGITYDWEDKYLPIVAGMPEAVTGITNADAKTAITSAQSGFSSIVMHLTGSGAHDIGALTYANNPDFYKTGYIYTISFDYYCVSAGGHYLIMYDGTSGNKVLDSNFFESGLNKAELEFAVAENGTAITIYGDMDIYIGNMTITYSEPIPDSPYASRTDYYPVTSDEINTENGYTFDYSENNAIQAGDLQYADISKLDTALNSEMTSENGFSAQAIYAKSASGNSNYIWTLSKKLTVSYDYVISFNAYVVNQGDATILTFVDGAGQNSRYNFSTTNVSGNIYNYKAEFTAIAGDDHINFYVVTACEIYIGNLTISGTEHITQNTTANGNIVGDTWTKTATEVFSGKGTTTATPTEMQGLTGFSDNVTTYEMSGDMTKELYNLSLVLEDNAKYKITVYYYVNSAENCNLYMRMDSDFKPLTSSVGYHEAVLTDMTKKEFVSFYTNAGLINISFGSMKIELTEIM